jgi:hypothetical protein
VEELEEGTPNAAMAQTGMEKKKKMSGMPNKSPTYKLSLGTRMSSPFN